MIRAITNVWGLILLYDAATDELSAECVCGGAAMYGVRIVLSPAERTALKDGRLDFQKLSKEMCDSDDFRDRHVALSRASVKVDSIDELLAQVP